MERRSVLLFYDDVCGFEAIMMIIILSCLHVKNEFYLVYIK